MLTINTDKKYTIFAEVLEDNALQQFESAMQQPFVTRGALMPDTHTGYSLPIGAVIETENVIVPAWVGYDIGCGVCAIETTFNIEDIKFNGKNIFNHIYKDIPVGFNHNKKNVIWENYNFIPKTETFINIFKQNGLKQLCSLGGGNHFIEIGFDTNNKIWIVIHSGSRGIGHAIATHYMKLASGDGKAREGHFGFNIYTENFSAYITDLNACVEFALQNRIEILLRIEAIIQSYCEGNLLWKKLINRTHNHAENNNGKIIHRKGATHAEKDMMGVIPGNIKDGSFIVRGKGNNSSLFSSSHGAGRVLGRKKAKETLNIETFISTMEGIIAKVDKSTLDESPFAYKNIFEVMNLQKELVEIVNYIKPLINIKG